MPDTTSNIPMAQPVIGAREEELVLEVLRSGQLSLGQKTLEFEAGLAARLGMPHGRAVSSGTAGLHLALRAVGVGAGDEVITSPLSFIASANSVLFERAIPKFVDIDPVTLNMDPEAVADAITPATKAILPVHIFGYPADTPAMERHGLPIVEDACEALGATHADGVPVGGRGHSAVFAFYANKQLATGEGGMVVTNDAAIAERIGSERNQGRAPDMGWLDHDRLGFNYRMSELQAALGVAQLERLDQMLADRARVAGGTGRRSPISQRAPASRCPARTAAPSGAAGSSSWCRCPRGIDRDDVLRGLRAVASTASPTCRRSISSRSTATSAIGRECSDLRGHRRALARPAVLPAMEQTQVERVAARLTELVLAE